MAEVLYNVAAGIILSLSSSAMNEIGLWWGISGELKKLRQTIGTIEAVLLHAEEQSIHNPQLKHWLGLLSEALYDADDLLDEFSYEALHQQVMGGSKISKKVRLFCSSSNQFVFGLKMGRKVKAIRERLDEIAAEKNKFHLEERCCVERSFVPEARYQTHSYPPEVVIGREHEREEIVRLLLSSDCDENVSVVSIVGIGGLGKTTLAQMVYNDDRVKNHFELRMWVCVSDDFDVQLLVKKTLESVTKKAPKSVEMDSLRDFLHEKINGRKYLLVLDDVWNEDVNKWFSFKDLLTGGDRGSKIVITTRLRTVAEMSRPISIHELGSLSKNDSWSLFKKVAFKQGQLLNPSLEAMGKEIASKCCGVPLAIKTIGGMLYLKDPNFEWILFRDNELSKIDVFKHDILPILRLSYNHLPSHYKHCFAYCSLYPKDIKISVDILIHLWKAQGYVKQTNLNGCLQDAGFEYFMDLYRMSFFQDVEKDDIGNIKYCKMHDLMHDLAVSVSGINFSTSYHEMKSIENNTLHVSYWGHYNYVLRHVLKAKKIRTILTLHTKEEEEVDEVFCNWRCLRVLGLSCITTLPNSIYKLKHLRYLDISCNNDIQKLPDSITNLHNLQALNIKQCGNLVQLPHNITKLVNLTDLDNQHCDRLSHMPQGIGKLTRLEKLSEYVISMDHSITNHTGGLDELHSLNNLRGELKIKNLRYVKNAAYEFKEAHLSLKQKLQRLILDWGKEENNNCSENEVVNEEMGMEALCPHPNLKELGVLDYRGSKAPSWLPFISTLVSVSFWDCGSIKWFPPLDQLPHLKTIWLWSLTNLERIDVENRRRSSLYFPSLKNLFLINCPKLKGFERLTEELPCFPCLSQLKIRDCPNLTSLPLFPELKKFYLDRVGIKFLPSLPFSTLSRLQYLEFLHMEDSRDDELLQYLLSLQPLSFRFCSLFECMNSHEEDDAMQWRSLSVVFVDMENSVDLPKGLQYVTTLQRLYIDDCPSLECVPEWMPNLIALRDLRISRCPQLEERCKNNTAEGWPYISHIPNISINNEQIQRNGCYLK